MSIWIVSIILAVAVILLVTERFSVDLTALGIIVAVIVTGLLSPKEAVGGFANPAVVTVAAMFLLSRAMIRTGALNFISEKITQGSKGNPKLAFVMILVIVALASAFINNTPVVVLFIPIIMNLSCDFDLSPSKILIPMSYASILAGTCTLIGTSTNIIVKDLSEMYGYGGIGMFELSALGVPIAIVGMVFIFLTAHKLMPSHAVPICEISDREDKLYLAELTVKEQSELVGKDLEEVFAEKYPSFQLYEIVRGDRILYPHQTTEAMANDLLLVKGTASDFVAILHDDAATLPHQDQDLNYAVEDNESVIVELIIPPQSSLINERLMDTHIQDNTQIHVIAVKRRQVHYTEQKLKRMRLRIGDIILARCSKNSLERLRADGDFIPIEDVHHEILHKRKARYAISIFGAMILAATMGVADIMACALTAVFLMILTGCLHLRDAYRALRSDVLLLIVGTIALGTAMEKTGASKVYADAFLSLFEGFGPRVVLAGIILLTSVGTQLLSNNATAVLVIPIAISTALSLGINPKPFIIGVCFGASACYATPIGYQTNLMVYGPGSYRFLDYFKLGIPLNLLVVLAGTFFIPEIWPF